MLLCLRAEENLWGRDGGVEMGAVGEGGNGVVKSEGGKGAVISHDVGEEVVAGGVSGMEDVGCKVHCKIFVSVGEVDE